MVLPVFLEVTELKYKNKLEEYFSQIFRDIILPSHDLSHHKRVWNFAKELLQSLNNQNIEIRDDIPEKLIIGCYLHDSGMAIDRGIRHGHHSMLFCRRFLENNKLDVSDFTGLLSVLEKHDEKDYSTNGRPEDLFTILSAADDLDALGITGIYRYSEIYLARGKSIKELGPLVQENVAKRYDHFAGAFSQDSYLINKHKLRYNQVEDFFSEFNRLSGEYKFDGNAISGNCGVIEIIASRIKNKHYSINDIIADGLQSEDVIITDFYKRLAGEL
jgi:HD superfamily phosphodiesterase